MAPRTILYTGKGGVGKTSVAAATARRCAGAGLRTIVLSTDPAHSLSDSLGCRLGAAPSQIGEHLWGQEVAAQEELERNWSAVQEWLGEILVERGVDRISAEELTVPPGLDELFSLLAIRRHHESDDYDVIVVDCAPTGETLQLLTFPDAAKWWLDKIYPWERRAMKVARPMLQKMIDVPLPGDDVYVSLRELLIDLEGMKKLLTDTSITSVRIVLNLEKMVVKEAKRAYTYLSLFGYSTDAVIVNRLLPPEVHDELFQKWQRIQERYRVEVEQSFTGIPILNVPLFDREVIGEKMLLRMAQETYGEQDPSQHFATSSPQRIDKDGTDYVLTLKVPFADRSAVDLNRHNGELYVTVGNYRREISLPRVLAQRDTSGATIRDGELRVRFARREQKATVEGKKS
jgi:arsenite-transporting ATPase